MSSAFKKMMRNSRFENLMEIFYQIFFIAIIFSVKLKIKSD